ncbi:hypothetical protein H257_08770 [Aphanomyces astaci]|uniref:Uncharacterized protein n=1 Tax=Aphanomyces astaci TaxID=112090 RepID=W4GE28_APHAT|nr:hypothetical protein H257_08770 [Aphanomyces astaci]ETV77324.1 hypothetical protein H257_08770 [Aphanomyces astaci]|eukprot:XP_009833111.1 hypothetical protein H257_08770 [Aphanomyces astaci]
MVRCNFSTFEGRDKVEITEEGSRKLKSRIDVKYFKPFTRLMARNCLLGDSGDQAAGYDSSLPREQDVLPNLPGQLVGLRPAHFVRDVLDPRRERILRFWSDVDIDQVEENHSQLVTAYNNDPVLRRTLDEHDNSTTFDDALGRRPSLMAASVRVLRWTSDHLHYLSRI